MTPRTPVSPAQAWLRGAWAVLEKDARLELRSRYAFNMLLLFAAGAILLMLFAADRDALEARMQAGLLWVVVLFSAAVGLGHAFLSEEEGGTVLLLQLNARPGMVFAGKLAFTFGLVLLLNLLTTGAFLVLLGLPVAMPLLLAATFVLGGLGLSGATTFIAAVIARASGRGPLLPVLLFPVLAPLLLSVVRSTEIALTGRGWAEAADELLALAGYAGVVITAGALLFDYIWTD